MGIQKKDCIVLDFEVRRFPEFRQQILDKMIELGLNKTIQLEFNSNFLAWNDIWFDRVTKFKGLMMASIDDIGLRAEYTRYQTDWKRVEENFKKFVEISKTVVL